MSTEIIAANTDVIVDGDLSAEKLVKLIELAREEERLDYKLTYDLSAKATKRHRVELACDVVSMANTHGGYIVLGVAETDGQPKKYNPAGIDNELFKSLDIDQLRPQITSYINADVDLKLKIHHLPVFGDKAFACIYVAKKKGEPIVFEKPGQYMDENGKQQGIFRSGDIYIRKGASSVRADQNDVRRIISEIRRYEKDRWTEEILGIRDLVARLDTLIGLLAGSTDVTQIQASSIFDGKLLYLSQPAFEEEILELLGQNKRNVIKRYLSHAISQFYGHIEELNDSDSGVILETQDNYLLPILDNLVVLGKVFIQYEEKPLFDKLEKAFYQICRRAQNTTFITPKDESFHFNKSWVWKEIIIRAYALGALLIAEEKFSWTPSLIRQRADWGDNYFLDFFWSRYILTMLAREGRLEEKSLCRLSVKYIENSGFLKNAFLEDQDAIIGASCQFDFLQCVHANAESDKVDLGYPSFGIYRKYRTTPIIIDLIEGGKARAAIPNIPDAKLADIIRDLDRLAGKEFFNYHGWRSDYWGDQRIEDFLAQHPPQK